jgi:hypothetical protein
MPPTPADREIREVAHCVRIKRSTRRRLTRYPSAWSARCIRGLPYVPPLWVKIGRIARIRR